MRWEIKKYFRWFRGKFKMKKISHIVSFRRGEFNIKNPKNRFKKGGFFLKRFTPTGFWVKRKTFSKNKKYQSKILYLKRKKKKKPRLWLSGSLISLFPDHMVKRLFQGCLGKWVNWVRGVQTLKNLWKISGEFE